ncbi:MAG TPA: thiamine pyrophosphate-dependent enzyme [Kineosporiaceae bacterium]
MSRSGAEALVAQLEAGGVRHVFGVPGVQLDHVLDALARSRDAGGRIEYIVARHEQGAAHLAEGYARSTGRPGVCLVVPGPGVLNALPALATGYACSSPLLCLAADLPSALVGRGLGLLHELPDQEGILRSLTKWTARARTAEEIPALAREALRQTQAGRPRPVALTLPADLLAAPLDPDVPSPEPDVVARAADTVAGAGAGPDPAHRPDPDRLDEVAVLLAAARRPLIFAGGGVLAAGATAALTALAETLRAPVVVSRNAGGAVSSAHALGFSSLAAPQLLPAADVVLVVGSRFVTPRGSAIPVADTASVVLINADPLDLGPPRRAGHAIQADARVVLGELLARLTAADQSASDWPAQELAAIRARCQEQVESIQPQWGFVRALREAIPEDGFLVNELTQVGYLASVGYPVHRPGTFLTPGYQGTLGYGYPTALGVKVGHPDRAVVSINGDGGFCWNLQELATARKYDLAVTAVVFNDNAFGNVRTIQREEFGGRYIGSELVSPDFVRLAESFGVPGSRVTTPAELSGALKDALSAPGPVVIEVPVQQMPSVWPLLLGGSPGSVRV